MAGVIDRRHITLSSRLAAESNRLLKSFSVRRYSKLENLEKVISSSNLSVESKKKLLEKKLRDSILLAFSIDKRKLEGSHLLLGKRLHEIRKIIIKLRSLNYYLETIFEEKAAIPSRNNPKTKVSLTNHKGFERSELEALEYAAYKLIEEAIVLDKRLLKGYSQKEKIMLAEEKTDSRDIRGLLAKESVALEHLDAKIPPQGFMMANLLSEPNFTHWVARIFSLLSYIEYLWINEGTALGKLKKNKSVRLRISRKISRLLREKTQLMGIMEQKAYSMEKFSDAERKKLHSLTAATNM